MSVKKEPSGRRSVQVEVEVPGTPEEVWRAIATGPGITSWFVPTRFEGIDEAPERLVLDFGPGMESVARITRWNPPHGFSAESDWAPGGPPIATEWTVEARSGGTCVVRVVHSLFADGDDWDGQLEGTETGWPCFFRILGLYLAHFAGESCQPIQVTGFAPEPVGSAWKALAGKLGLADATVGEERAAPSDAPPLAGTVVFAAEDEKGCEALLRLDEPCPGAAHVFAMPMGGQVMLILRLYLYGERAREPAARDEPRWRQWVAEKFPPPSQDLR